MQFAFGKFDFYQRPEPPKEAGKICKIEKKQVDGRNVFTLSPKAGRSDKHILYLHGGAYVQNFVSQHWKFLTLLVEQTHCTITAPDYPLAPKHTYLDAFKMVIPVYKEMISNLKSTIILMGDSAGGGFALALAQKMSLEKIAQPTQIILLSPWLDLTLQNPEIKNIDLRDPFLGITGLLKVARIYAGNSRTDNFMLSPINGPLDQLGDISIFIGSNDIFAADTRKFNSLVRAKGIKINYREYQGMVHVWMLLSFRESRQAQKEIIDLIRK